MIVSLNWLKKYTNTSIPVEELSGLIGTRLVEIETTKFIGEKYKGSYVVKIVECDPIEGTDHLNVTKIDDGGKVENVERDENGLVQVVCGAPNVRAGIIVAWLPPGSTVPDSFDDAEPFVLSAKNLRGVISNGMLASAKELDLFEDHTGILELSDELPIGSTLDVALELDDTLFDIENKSLTHRPDTFGIIGFAREVAAIQDLTFITPDWLRNTDPNYGEKYGDIETPSVYIDNSELSERYQAVVLSGADSTRQSPLWVQTYLSRVGVRPINAVVDVTNYLMMLTGQPLHAFDYDKVRSVAGGSPDIHVRAAFENETLELLDGKIVTLNSGDITIAAGETAIGLAGAMGGANTAIDDSTQNIILESATFNLYNLRSTQMRHGIFSEAITRFTKGQPAGQTAPVLAEAVRLLSEWAGASRVSDVADAYPGKNDIKALPIKIESLNAVLGTELTVDDVIATLKNTEFSIQNITDTGFDVTAPYWRTDIHIVEDIIEEVGRLQGFDNITLHLPKRDFTAVYPTKFDELRKAIRQSLAGAGANEVLTYSFVHGDILKKANQNPDNSYRITNSISPDLQYYRQSVTPSLINLVFPNVKQGYKSFGLFELNKTHQKSNGLTSENVPQESNMVALTLTNKKDQTSSAFYDAKFILDYLGKKLELKFNYVPLEHPTDIATYAPFEPKKSALVRDVKSGIVLGIVGEYRNSVSRSFKLPEFTAGFELDILMLFKAQKHVEPEYKPLSKYPSSERDICFQVKNSVTYEDILICVEDATHELSVQVVVSPLDIYQPDDKETKNVTIRLEITSYEKTLTGEDINSTVDHIGSAVIAKTQAVII